MIGSVFSIPSLLDSVGEETVRVHTSEDVSKEPQVFTIGLKGNGKVSNFVSDQSYAIILTEKGEAQLTAIRTVTFKANGGTGDDVTQEIIDGVSTALTANSFTREGYEFTGWNMKQDGSGTSYADKAVANFSEDCTLYAQWRKNEFAVASLTNKTYTGKDQKPTITVTDVDTSAALTENTDFTVSWTKDGMAVTGFVSAGDYTATVTGIGKYQVAEPKTVTFTIQKTAPAVTAPVAKTNLSYTGSALELVTPGSVNGGTMQYALGTATEATQPYTTSIPTATDAGT